MRKRKPKVRHIAPDPRYSDPMVTQFVNNLMYDGKKSTSFSVFYDALDIIKEKTGENEHNVWKKALQNAMPQVEVRSRRIGGATYQVPIEVNIDRRHTLAIRWIVINARKRNEKTMEDRLVGELLDALNNRGSAVKKKEEVHRMAEANKAFAHYRF